MTFFRGTYSSSTRGILENTEAFVAWPRPSEISRGEVQLSVKLWSKLSNSRVQLGAIHNNLMLQGARHKGAASTAECEHFSMR
jgi:hypothetical protein